MARVPGYRRAGYAGVGRGGRSYVRPARASLADAVRGSSWEILAMAVAVLSVAYIGGQMLATGALLPEPAASGPQYAVHFGHCDTGVRRDCVVDGDTIWLKGRKIRIADIDAPEVFSPQCGSELALGNRATARLQDLLNAGPIEITGYPQDEDVYGRKLRIVRRDGESIGAMLVSEGLARKWDGARHSWC